MTRRVGIEISASAVRIAEVEAGARPRLISYAEQELPRGIVVDGAVVDVDLVRNAVADCVGKGHIRGHAGGRVEAHLGITGLRAITREIEMPRLSDTELDAAARLQAMEIVPFPAEDAILSARRLGPVENAENPTDRVLIAAAHRDLVEPVVKAAEAAGVTVLSVEFAPFALVRSLADPGAHGAEAIVSIGADLTTVVIHENGEPLLVRTIAGGGASITRAIAAALDLPFADAETMKFLLGDDTGTSRPPLEATAAARDATVSLIAEIRSSLQYFATLHGGVGCESLVVTGGGSRLAGLEQRLSQQLAVTVVRRSAIQRLGVRRIDEKTTKSLEELGAVVVGTALPPAASAKSIDLLPPEILAERRERRVERRVIAGAAVFATLLIAGGALRFLQVNSAERGVAALQSSIQVLKRQIPKYDVVEAQRQAMITDSSIATPLVSTEVNWPAVIQAIDRYTPSGVGAATFAGTAGSPPTATASTTTAGSATLSSSSASLSQPTATIGSVSLTLTTSAYPAFEQWFDSITSSQRLSIVSFSGLSSTGKQVSFSAQLAVSGRIRTSRLSRFEVGGL